MENKQWNFECSVEEVKQIVAACFFVKACKSHCVSFSAFTMRHGALSSDCPGDGLEI